jgi:hypothetical protein
VGAARPDDRKPLIHQPLDSSFLTFPETEEIIARFCRNQIEEDLKT